eukprot:CAMPEP_0176065538 /NCGR_PEP_ID=MMETSP0120_2-20121206/32699_1 /TAXON_ID=160619 /ORGANISM="Kryptoperidinium foliaceum, Strain CCMP 1326" /LENGTH=389 /DNA_ID=CAMNT_0017399131 /DNA_START=80 /DNA_END=1249 /DNA_ORIENTATION=+
MRASRRRGGAAPWWRRRLPCCAAMLRAASGAVCGSTFSAGTDLATSTAGNVRALAYIDDGGSNQFLAAGGEDTILRVWTLSPLSATPRLYRGHDETIWALEWIAALNVLASGSGDGTIRLWPLSVLAADQACSGIADCCDGSGLGCQGEHVLSWTITGMTRRRQIHSLEWVPGSGSAGTLVSAWGDGAIRTWIYDGTSWSFGVDLQADGNDIKDRAYDMVWMAGASVLATGSEDWPHPRLWSSLTAAKSAPYVFLEKAASEDVCPSTFAHCDAVLALAADSAGNKLASGSRDKSIILWTASTKVRIATLTAHTDYVTSLAWLDSEGKLASGSADGTIMLWDATVTADATAAAETLTGHSGTVGAVVWMENQKMLAGADSSGNVKLWTCV